MGKGKCHECVYAGRLPPGRALRDMSAGWPTMLLCVNHAGAPGVVREVLPGATCRNFRARRKPPVRPELPVPPSDDVRYIALTRGLYATVSTEDYERLNKYRWSASPSGGGKMYARRNTKHGTVLMHREIMNPPPGMVVDHIDGNGLNNHRTNLRLCSAQQNECNKPPRGRRSKFKGVYPRGGKWYSTLRHEGVPYYLGTFDTEIEAARARDHKAVELQGPFAYVNLPEEWPGHPGAGGRKA